MSLQGFGFKILKVILYILYNELKVGHMYIDHMLIYRELTKRKVETTFKVSILKKS